MSDKELLIVAIDGRVIVPAVIGPPVQDHAASTRPEDRALPARRVRRALRGNVSQVLLRTCDVSE